MDSTKVAEQNEEGDQSKSISIFSGSTNSIQKIHSNFRCSFSLAVSSIQHLASIHISRVIEVQSKTG